MTRRLDVTKAARTVERLRRQADVLASLYPDARACPPHVREEIASKRRTANAIEDAVLRNSTAVQS